MKPEKKQKNKMKSSLELQSFIPHRIVNIADTISQSLAKRYSQNFGVSIPEWRVLAILGSYHSLSAKELAKKTNLGKVKLSRTTKKMFDDNMIKRKVDPIDGRVVYFSLTAKGKTMYQKIVPLALEWQEALFSELSSSEIKQLDKIIDTLAARVQAIDSQK